MRLVKAGGAEMSLSTRLRTLVLGISPEEATFVRRGFRPADPRVRQHLEHIGQTFVRGYNTAVSATDSETLAAGLREVGDEFCGFAYEGAAMGLALLDFMTPWKPRRWRAFLNGPGAAHPYMFHVGVGWAAARLPWVRRNIPRHLRRLDPLLRWLVVDGYGFHEGYFHWPRYANGLPLPGRLSGYSRRAFDQGLGRCLWFIECADIERIAATIDRFPPQRHADLFSGVGLGCAYAGGAKRAAIETLCNAAGVYRPQLAQGAAFAAKARQRAGNLMPHTRTACEVLCGASAEAAAALTDECLTDLPQDGAQPAYEYWRQRIHQRLGGREVEAGRI